ncbi:MAG TPA: MFS transporter [Terrimesophilobacter sp.]|uniref:MFS transporter n=1 Tax=Terrimesophilobacter sp. TaxID=2906435 RepID=UPI002F931405
MSTAEPPPFRFRSIALPAILPTLAFSIGEGAIIPIIPIVAHNLGAQLAIAGLIAAMITIGQLFGDIPSGWIISRIGERAAMIYAALLSIAGLALAMLSPNPWVLGIAVFLIGLATAVFALARHAFMTSFVPIAFRARALSTLGGSFRLGLFIGPFAAAAIIHLTGSTQSAFWVHIGGCLVAAALLIFLKDPEATFRPTRTASGRLEGEELLEAESRGLFRTIAAHRGVLARLGTGAALIGALRASRQVMLPLWAVSIGISDANTALIIGIAGGLDFALFYTTGQIMDRWGRMWTALPSMVGLGLGHLALAFTRDLPGNVAWFIAIAMVLAVANGFGSGLLMTLGADLADKDNPAPFLGAWRFTSDAGGAAAPLAISGLTALVSLSFASGAMGILGLAGAAVLWRYLPRFAPHTR